MDDCKQLLRTDQSQSALSSCLVIIIKHCQSSWYSPPTLQKKNSFCTFALQNLQGSHCQIFGGFPMVYFVHFWNQTFHFQRLSIWSTEFTLQKTRSLVNLSEWSALSILIHRALVTQSSPPKVLLDVSAFGIISSDLSCFVWPKLKLWTDEG